MAPTLAELRAKRAHDCRLAKERALRSVDEAEAFLRERRMLTQTQDSALPSLFTAIHEPPYAPGRSGFGSWPRDSWWWGFELASRSDAQPLKIHKGKLLLLAAEAAAVVDPLCRDALSRAEDGELGPDAQAIVASIGASGPRPADVVRGALGLATPAFRAAREKLEREGAIVARFPVPRDGKIEQVRPSATLARWDQSHPQRRKASLDNAVLDLVALGVRAAVVVQEDEPRAWFTWPVPRDAVRRLLEAGRLIRPAAGWVAAASVS